MPSLMLVPVAVSEELKQTHIQTERIALDILNNAVLLCRKYIISLFRVSPKRIEDETVFAAGISCDCKP